VARIASTAQTFVKGRISTHESFDLQGGISAEAKAKVEGDIKITDKVTDKVLWETDLGKNRKKKHNILKYFKEHLDEV